MQVARREFIERSLAATCVAVLGSGSSEAEARETPAASADLLSAMTWLNEPASVKRSGATLAVTSRAKTDFWRKTYYGYVTDNGHFLSLPATGDFLFEARVNGAYAALYDQAGLMVRADAKTWIKCGTEFVDGKRNASVVFTREFSDWSTMPDLSQSEPVWWRAVRKRDSIETFCSVDGKTFVSTRQGYFPPNAKARVGLMCAAPEGPGFEAVFDAVRLERLAPEPPAKA